MLRFASREEALQHLSNITGSKVKIAYGKKEEQEDFIIDASKEEIEKMLQNEDIININGLLGSAIHNKRDEDIVQLIIDNGAKFHGDDLNSAIQNEDEKMVRRMVSEGLKIDSYDYETIIQEDLRKMLTLAIELDKPDVGEAFILLVKSAKNDNEEMVEELGKYLYGNK